MKKIYILFCAIIFLGASCNLLADPFGSISGEKGVLKSEDNGESFRSANALVGNTKTNISGFNSNVLVFAPNNSEIIYLGGSSGVYKSENGGQNWRYVLSGLRVADIAIDPYDSEKILVGGIAGGRGKIIKSGDAGKTWVDMFSEPSGNNAVLALSFVPGNSSMIIAGLTSADIIRSVDEGKTWQTIKNLQSRIVRIKISQQGTAYALTYNNGLYKSGDFGSTWTALNSVSALEGLTNYTNRTPVAEIYYDLDLDKRQNGVIYLSSDRGVMRSVNDGANWNFVNLPVKNASLKSTAIAVSPHDSNVILTAINDTVFKPKNGGVSWETKKLPTQQTVRVIRFHPDLTNVIFLGMGDVK